MRYVRMTIARLRGLFAGHRVDDDLREELESHLEMETAELMRRGLDPETARRQARLASGGLTQAAEAVREQRGLPWIDNAMADLRYGLRSLRRNRGFTAVVVITLALGIGATTAIFSVVRGVLLKPLPHRDGDRLVYLRHSTDGLGGENMLFSVPEIRDLRAGAPAFTYIAEYSPWDAVLKGDIWVPEGHGTSSPADKEADEIARRVATLTAQQIRVLMMLSDGLMNKQIAYELSISEATVKAHVSSILQKLDVDSRTQAVIAASRIEQGQFEALLTRNPV